MVNHLLLFVRPGVLMATLEDPVLAWLVVSGRAALAEGGLEDRLTPVLPEESLPATTDPRRENGDDPSSPFSRLQIKMSQVRCMYHISKEG